MNGEKSDEDTNKEIQKTISMNEREREQHHKINDNNVNGRVSVNLCTMHSVCNQRVSVYE